MKLLLCSKEGGREGGKKKKGKKDYQIIVLKVFFVFVFLCLKKKGGGEPLRNYKSSEILTQEKTFQIKCFPEKNIWQRLALVFPNNH